MFDENKELNGTVAKLEQFCEKLNRGDTLFHDDIERITNTPRWRGQWGSIVAKIRRYFLDRQIALKSERGLGYHLCWPVEQLEYCSGNRLKRATKQITRGVTEIKVIGAEDLNDHQQRLRVAVMASSVNGRKHLKRIRNMVSQELRKTETMPLLAAG